MVSKRQILSIEVKKSVLEAVESGTTNQSELSRRFKIDRKMHFPKNDVIK